MAGTEGAVPIPLNGRRAEALRNNERILRAARSVLIEEGYDATMATIAHRAGVGVGTLYRRYPSKDQLIQQMSIAGMREIIEAADDAIASQGDPWEAFGTFMRRCVQAGAGELLQFAGGFRPSRAQRETSEQMRDALNHLLAKTSEAGAIRPDVTSADIYILFAQLRLKLMRDPQRNGELQQRYLSLVLRGLRHGGPPGPLDGPAPTWPELQALWKLADSPG